jgi:hypothetical protein
MPLGTVALDLLDFAQRQVDRIVPPASRQNAYNTVKEFATARPMLFVCSSLASAMMPSLTTNPQQSFIVAQITFSTLPVLCFFTFVFSIVLAFSTVSLFIALFWVGVAFLLLVPILVLTSSVALFTWGFGAAGFILSRWSYNLLKVNIDFGNIDFGNPHSQEDPDRPRLARPAASSSSLSGASWARVEAQEVKQDDESEGQSKEPAHPEPGSDLDALEP